MSIVSSASAASAAAAPSLPQKTSHYFAAEIDAVVSKKLKSITGSELVENFTALAQDRRAWPKRLDSLMSVPIQTKQSLKNCLGKDANHFCRVSCEAALSLAQVEQCVAEFVEATPVNPAAVTHSAAYITARDNAGIAGAALDKVFNEILRPKKEQLAHLSLIPSEKIWEWQQEEAIKQGHRFP